MTDHTQTGRRVALLGNQAFSLINFRRHLIEYMVGRGIEVFALAPDFSEETRAAIALMGATAVDVSFSRTGMNPFSDLSAMIRLIEVLRGLECEAFLAFAAKPVIYGTIAARLAGISRRYAMIEGLGYIFIGNEFRQRVLRPIVKTLYRNALRLAHRVFFLNDEDKSDFLNWSLLRPEQVVRIDGIGIDLEHWRPAPAVAEPITFLFVGRLIRDKGIEELVEASRQVKEQFPDVRFVVLGDVDANPKSVTAADARGWVKEGLVDWPGHVDVGDWMAGASVFVLPSYREGLPRSTLEAMAMARPIITTDVPGCRETVIEGLNGYLVKPRSASAIAEAMTKFLLHPDQIASMGAESRKIAEARFDVHKINAQVVGVMQLE